MADDDRDLNPGTKPFIPVFDDDTGERSQPFVPDFDDTESEPILALGQFGTESAQAPSMDQPSELPAQRGAEPTSSPTAADESVTATATEGSVAPIAVPGRYQYVKWWKLLLVVLGAWFVAAEIGLSLFYWWYHTLDKTAAVYVVLVYVVACTVVSLMLSMVQGIPLLAALSLGVMSGPFASVAAAAPLYGYYYCEHVNHCLVGVIPY